MRVFMNTFSHEYLCDLWVNHNQILSDEAVLRVMEMLDYVFSQIESKIWFQWQHMHRSIGIS